MKVIISLLLVLVSFTLSAEPQGRHIFVEEKGVVTAKPDIATISFELNAKNDDSHLAKKAVDTTFNQFLKGLKEFDVKAEDISASSLLTERNYQYDEQGNDIPQGFTAKRTVKITLRNLQKLNKFLDYALSVGMGVIESVDLSSSKKAEFKEQARAEAIKKVISKAESTARLFDMELGTVYSIDSGYSRSYQSYGFANDSEKIVVTGSRININKKDIFEGQYLEAKITFSESVKVVFDLIEP